MSDKKSIPLIPFQVKVRPEIRAKMKKVAADHGLSLNDVAGMMITAGLPLVDRKLAEIQEPEKEAA